jgi:hypothetical protein
MRRKSNGHHGSRTLDISYNEDAGAPRAFSSVPPLRSPSGELASAFLDEPEDIMTEKEKDALRITNQFRSKGSMVYDLRCNGERLTVTVSPRTTEQDGGEWRVEARAGGRPVEDIVERWGATRIDALRAVGRAWTEQLARGLPRFDWEAVAQALITVRAV